MAVIDSVLRQQRWQLEERREYLTSLESLAARLHADMERLQQEAEREAKLVGLSVNAPSDSMDPVFLRPLIERCDKLRRSIAEIEAQIAEAQAAVQATEQELRVFEVSHTAPWERAPIQRLTRRSRRLQQSRMRQAALRLAGN